MTQGGRRRPGPAWDEGAEVALRFRAKEELRKRLGAVRARIPEESRLRRSREVANRLAALEPWRNATTIAGYVAMRGEVDPAPALDAARGSGRRIVLPRVEPDQRTMTFRTAEGALEVQRFGFHQPREDAAVVPPSEIDLVLVPALAADMRGHRLGYGGGFYDRALPTLPRTTSVALVFHFQLMAELPDTPGDVRVDVVVTDQTSHEVTSGDV